MVKRLGEVNIDKHHPLPDIVTSNKKMRRDCHSSRCWVVCFGMDLRPSDRCHDSGHMVLWFLFFLRFVKGFLEIWKESTNFRFASCLTFFWVRYVDAIGRNDVGHLRKRFRIFSKLPEAFRKKQPIRRFGAIDKYPVSYLFEVPLGLCLSKVFPRYQECAHFQYQRSKIMFSHCLIALRLGRARCLTSRWRGPLRHTS